MDIEITMPSGKIRLIFAARRTIKNKGKDIPMDKQHQVLKQIFGYETFRAGQEGLVDSVLSGRDVLGVMPTGAGKSICYQVPALILPCAFPELLL